MLFSFFLQGCGHKPLEEPNPPAAVRDIPDNWIDAQTDRMKAKELYIAKHKVAYDWFGNFAFSETDGVPYIILKLLPEIAPEFWGKQK